jgi:hypothetical protein
MITLPDGNRVWLVHDLRSRIGTREAVNTVCGGRTTTGDGLRLSSALSVLEVGLALPDKGSRGVEWPDEDFVEFWLWYWIMPKIFSGCLLDDTIVVTPAAVAISAAMSFVSMPPVPRLEPNVVVLTECHP